MTITTRWKCFCLLFIFILLGPRSVNLAPRKSCSSCNSNALANDETEPDNNQFQVFPPPRPGNIPKTTTATTTTTTTPAPQIFGCTSDMQKTFTNCLGKCSNSSCCVQELFNFFSACSSGVKQNCTTTPTESRRAICTLQTSDPNSIYINGVIEITQAGPSEPVLVKSVITAYTDQDVSGNHGFHIHTSPVPSSGDCTGTGGHYNPFEKDHGAPDVANRHVGDLGNIVMTKGEDGIYNSAVDITDSQVTLFGDNSVIGRGIVLHAGEDDLGLGGEDDSLTTGHAGSRIACCTIKQPEDNENCDQCGIANYREARRIGGTPKRPTKDPTRIMGGIEVNPHRRYPWQVGLFNPNEGIIFCGGSIINNRWILTAAHCVVDLDFDFEWDICKVSNATNGLQVRVGEHKQFTNEDDDLENTKDYTVKRIVIHPDWDCSVANYDFALLELTREIPFNDVIRPICLPADDSKTYAGVNATVTGWGLKADGNYYSDVLMEVEVPIHAQSDCKGYGIVEDSRLCAGPLPGKDACGGDSGGPLVVKEGNRYIQVGIVSSGAPCGDSSDDSGIYSRVSKVLDWIKNTTTSGKCF